MRVGRVVWTGVLALSAAATDADAQTLGTFRWQMQPYCNVITLDVTETGNGFRVEGTDDQCGQGADQASAIGTAFRNPDGTIGMGLTLVLAPGGVPVHVDVALAAGGFNGRWNDDSGLSGAFVLTRGAGNGGAARPRPTAPGPVPPPLPEAIRLSRDGDVVAEALGKSPIPATGAGQRMMWYGGKAAFRVGSAGGTQWDDPSIGLYSVAGGADTVASAEFSTAFGAATVASGRGSVALGYRTRATDFASFAAGDLAVASGAAAHAVGREALASGFASSAFGDRVVASGVASTAVGIRTTAGGYAAIAAGSQSTAYGVNSVAIGTNANTNTGGRGSFVFTDGNAESVVSSNPNQFLGRFSGGYVLWSTPDTRYPQGPGVQLPPGASAWSNLSDVNSKENFRDLSPDDVLGKLAAMPIRTWNYKAQDAAIRHVGPTAQDFHAAFGLGEDARRISTIDADGIALAGVQALEARTRAILERADRLERENLELRRRLELLEDRLAPR